MLLAALLLLLLAPARAAPLAAEGDALGDATVTDLTVHPEFHRFTVRLPDGRQLPLEVTVARQGSSPACVHHGLAVYPRWELLAAPGETPQVDPAGAATTRALCARLETDGKSLDIGILQKDKPDEAPPDPALAPPRATKVMLPTASGFTWRALYALPLALLLAGLAALFGPARRALAACPRTASFDLIGVLLLSLFARSFSFRGLLIGPDAGFERVEMAWDMAGAHPLYGGGFGALHAPLQLFTGFDPEAIFGLHLGLSALAPPLLWGLAWMLTRDRAGAATAGISLALLPVALRLAGSELEHVPLASIELLAVFAAWAWLRSPAPSLAILAALATALAAQLRPEALAFVLLPVGLLAAGCWAHRQRHSTAVVGALSLAFVFGLALARAVEIPLDGSATGAISTSSSTAWRLIPWMFTPRLWLEEGSRQPYQVFLLLGLTPFALPLLALLGVVRGKRRIVVTSLLWWALCLLPVIPKAWPQVDAWRLQLPAQAPLILLAAVGVAALGTWPRRQLLALGLVVLSALPLLSQTADRWAGQVEWLDLPGLIEELPDDAIVYVPDHEVHGNKVLQVGALLARRGGDERPDWRPLGPFAADPEGTVEAEGREAPDAAVERYAWVNLSCRIKELPGLGVANDRTVNPCLQLAERCRLTPFATTQLPIETDLDIHLDGDNREVGFFRIDRCGETGRPAGDGPVKGDDGVPEGVDSPISGG